MQLIEFTEKGLYCRAGGFYIDPWHPVERAVITHGHSDHSRPGSTRYLCHTLSRPILKLRLDNPPIDTVEWNEPVYMNGVKISLHPAGHIIGSSQVRVEHKGEVWVVSGDYKTDDDGISGAFEPVPCHTFITESTFGLPIYKWKPQQLIYDDIRQWVQKNREENRASVLVAYSLGKAQRVISALSELTTEIYAHGAIYNMQQTLRDSGLIPLKLIPEVTRVVPGMPKDQFKNAVIIAPPAAESSLWMKRFPSYNLGICSGWMQVRGNQRRKNADGGFVLSDHCDWKGLLQAIEATRPQKVFVTHGFQAVFSRYLNEAGIEAAEVKTEYGTEDQEILQETTSSTAEQAATDE